MGKKSREKRERRLARMEADPVFLMREMLRFHDRVAYEEDQETPFHKRLDATRAMLRQYRRLDAAIALSVSELWPANTGSPIKHIYAWGVLLDLPDDVQEGKQLVNYADFKAFAETLYETWPEFPMLEDFSPEADWGQIKVRLGQSFVPMLYGSCIERTPDFVEAFRITYAQVPEALAQMDLAVALQARIIEAMPGLQAALADESKRAHVEVPPEDFWQACSASLLKVGADVGDLRDKAGGALHTSFGTFKAPLTWGAFGDAAFVLILDGLDHVWRTNAEDKQPLDDLFAQVIPCPDNMVRHLLEDFAKPELNLRPSRIGLLDVIGNAYEFLIKNFASTSGKKAGEFYTPPEVSQLMALLVDPREGDEICDPTCGSASLLMKCSQLIRQRSGGKKYALFGQEAIGSTWALAKMNMFLHAEDNHRIEWGDTLRNPKLLDGNSQLKLFDIVVANPPFSLEKWGFENAEADPYKRFRRGVPPRTKADYAFILHMIETMKPGSGRMAVVVPHGVLFRGAAEGRIRKELIDENLLETVIGLPEKLFYGTGIPAAVLVFRKNKKDNKVLFIDASREYQDGKNQNQLRDTDLQKILNAAVDRKNHEKYAYLASVTEIAENDYNLNIPRYVDTFEEEAEIDLMAVRAEREKLKAELARLEEKMATYLKELGYE